MTTLKTVVTTFPAVQALASLKFRVTRVGFQVATYLRKMGEYNKTYEEQRMDLIKEMGTTKDDGRTYQIAVEDQASLTERLNDMQTAPVDDLIPPTVTLASDLKEGIAIKPWALAPLWGNVIQEQSVVTSEVALKRGELVGIFHAIQALGSVDITDLQLAYRIMKAASVIVPVVEAFLEEENAVSQSSKTPEEKGADMQALYEADAAEYSLPTFNLSDLDTVEVEPMVLLQLEKILKE